MENKNLKFNFLYSVGYQILIMIIPLISAPYISRVLGPEGLGIYSYVYSIVYYFGLFCLLGVANYGNCTIAKSRQNKEKLSRTFWEVYSIQLTLSIIVLAVYIFYIIFGVSNHKVIYTIQVLYLISVTLDINWFFFGLEEFKITVLRNAVIKILSVLFIFVFVNKADDLWKYTLIMGLSSFTSQIVLWFHLRNRVYFIKPTWKGIKNHIFPNLIYFIPVISVSIYKIMDKIMLGIMSDVNHVGFYENAEKIISIPVSIIAALGVVMLPRMSNLVSNGMLKESNKLIEKSMLFASFMGIAFTFGLIGVAPIFIPVYFGEEFEFCIKLISILSPTIFFISWANVIRTQYLIPNGKNKEYVISTLLGACVNVIINIILIPKYKSVGAAVGTIFAEATVCITQIISARNDLNIRKYIREGSVFLIFGLVMLFLLEKLQYLNISNLNLILLQILLGASLYIFLSYIYLTKINKKIRRYNTKISKRII